ncbi:MAG: aldehyde dehydrogenase family protein [Chloroflexi bacterium]|nr:aldehyde dehydrogenase family protein [Chloroflexota bacterium]
MDYYKLFINGEFVDAESGKRYVSIDPGNEKPIAEVALAGKADAEKAIAAARAAFDKGEWSGMTPVERMAKLQDFADQVELRAGTMGTAEAQDTGQLAAFAMTTPGSGAGMIRTFARMAAYEYRWQEELPFAGMPLIKGRELICREPLGVCVGIGPWNFPLAMAFGKIAPAIAMGNTIVFKPASYTPLSSLILAQAAQDSGIPKGVINIITGPGGEIGDTLCGHPDVDKISLTGSTEVGRHIMRVASDTIKKVTLELGGKSANIILDDADIDLAVAGACTGTFMHQGQICISGTRVLVSSKIYDEFLDKMKRRAESLKVGYQLEPDTKQGPLVSKEQLATVERYVKIGREEGAELVTGGKRVHVDGIDGGFYFAPTIFANVNNKMRIAQEEIFGPVVCVIKYDSDEEAVAIANDSMYGLAGGVFSRNIARAQSIARSVRTGTMFINNYHSLGTLVPFGGYKQSGVGCEFGIEGLNIYTQIKRIQVCAVADPNSNILFQMLSNEQMKLENVTYDCPTVITAGHGTLASINKTVAELGCRRAVILTDPGVKEAGLVELVKNSLDDLYAGVYDRIPSNPDLEAVDAAAKAARKLNADCIVSVGGGSVIDAAKLVCVILKNGGKANDHLNTMLLRGPQVPHVAVPTAPGTGSEVTNQAVITNNVLGRKVTMIDDRITPNAAILDPVFTASLSKARLLSSAMAAMMHAVEAVTSIASNPFCDGLALEAIRLINKNLPLAAKDRKDEKARLNLQIAANMAGRAFSIAHGGLAHGIAHGVITVQPKPYGEVCGIVLPKVMRFNAEGVPEKLARVAESLGVKTEGLSDQDAALAAADAVEALMKKVGLPLKLSEVGIPDDELMACALQFEASAVIYNGRPLTDAGALMILLSKAY